MKKKLDIVNFGSAANDAIQQQIELILLDRFSKRISFTSTITLLSIWVFGVPLWMFYFKQTSMLLWIFGCSSIFSCGYAIKTGFDRSNPIVIKNIFIWQLVFAIYSFFCGLSMGLGLAWLMWDSQGFEIGILVAILLCVTCVALNLTAAQIYSLWMYMFATMLCPTLSLFLHGEQVSTMIATLLLMSMLLMMLIGYDANQSLRQQINTDLQLRNAVSEASLAREQAEKANAFKSQFLARMSHEIRTPMNAVLGMLKLLQSTDLSGRQQDYTLKGEGAAKALLDLLNDVLDFSKMEAGQINLDLHPLSVKQLMQDLMVILQTNAAHKNLKVRFEIDPKAPTHVLGDTMRLRQVLINLASNAIKFTDRGHVLLRLQLLSQIGDLAQMRFAVEDTGIGIAPEKQTYIFEEFTQAESTIARRFGGTGLGLSISQQLVQAMGGSIHVHSTLGHGSTFSFELPMHTLPMLSQLANQKTKAPRPHPRDKQTATPSPQSLSQHTTSTPLNTKGRLANIRLLVIEDNLLNQQIALELLSLEGALVEVADHGAQGITKLIEAAPAFDAVLLDLQMPKMDGFAVTRVIRDELGMQTLPIIAMTANAMDSDRYACLSAGMNAHISKPFNIDSLILTLIENLSTNSRVEIAAATST